MRLIDADKLKHELIICHDLVGAKYTDLADTVEAITIEFLDKWFGNNYNAFTDLMMAWEKENEIQV